MKLEDIIALAKQGYKPADIKELMKLAEPEPEPEKPDDKSKGTESEPDTDPQVEPEAPEPEEPEVDYKKLYEDSQKELQKLQQENVKRNNANSDPVRNELDDIVRGFM